MARFPGAIWKPITADKDRQRLTVHNRMNLHVAASEATSLHGYFNQRGIPDSHFYVRRDGTVEQYVDTSMRAYADLEGNDATISVETQGGDGGGTWDPAQLASLVDLYVWAVRTHGIARKLATSSKTDSTSRGLSWHRLGCDGNFPSLPSMQAGRIQRGGGMHYSTSLGKICPGDNRIKQIPSIFTRAEAILAGASTTTTEADMTFTAAHAEQLDDLHRLLLRKFLEADQQVDVVDGVRRGDIVIRRIYAHLLAEEAAPAAAADVAAEDVADALLAKLTPALAKGVADTLYARLAQ